MIFGNDKIMTNEPAVGLLVSVRLVRTMDVGCKRFGFFLRQLEVTSGQSRGI
jgi:hypothetical protein